MRKDTLTLENLQRIYEAMSKIRTIDRSQFFQNYYGELEMRIDQLKKLENTKNNE